MNELVFRLDVTVYDMEDPGVGGSIRNMVIVAIVFFTILVLIEFKYISLLIYYIRCHHKKELQSIEATGRINADVQAEKNKVNEMDEDDLEETNLVIRNLTKFYGNLAVVKEICIAVER